MRPILYSTLLCSIALACARPAEPPPAPPAVDTVGVQQAVAEAWSRFVTADTAGDAAAMVGLFSEDAVVDVMGFARMAGRAAIDSGFRAVLAETDYTDLQIRPDVTVVVNNDLAFQSGSFMESYTRGGGRLTTDYGRYATSIERGADGQWRFRGLFAFTDSTVAARR